MVGSTADQLVQPVSKDNLNTKPATATKLHRAFVQPDNSCLFATVSFLCQGVTGPRDVKAASRKLREICALAALADPEADREACAAMLGHASVESCARHLSTGSSSILHPAFALNR